MTEQEAKRLKELRLFFSFPNWSKSPRLTKIRAKQLKKEWDELELKLAQNPLVQVGVVIDMAKGKNVSAQQMGREGGKKGGVSRAQTRSAADRKADASKGGKAKAANAKRKA